MAAVEFLKVSKKAGHASLTEVTFRAQDGEATCLTGPSGSGKSMIARMIAGHSKPDSGKVRVYGQDPFSSSLLSRRCSFVFGQDSLPQRLYLDDFLLHSARMYGFSEDDARKSLQFLGLWDVRHRRIGHLGHYRSEIAKFLVPVCRAEGLLLVDGMEKVLDDADVAFIYSRLFEMVRSGRISLLITTSRRQQVENYADRFIELLNGRVTGEVDVSGRSKKDAPTMCRLRVSDVIRGSMLLRALRVEGNSIILREPSGGLTSSISLLEKNGIRVLAFERLGAE